MTNGAGVCERMCVCLCEPPRSSKLIDREQEGSGGRGHAEIVIRQVKGHGKAEGVDWNCPVFVAVRVCVTPSR